MVKCISSTEASPGIEGLPQTPPVFFLLMAPFCLPCFPVLFVFLLLAVTEFLLSRPVRPKTFAKRAFTAMANYLFLLLGALLLPLLQGIEALCYLPSRYHIECKNNVHHGPMKICALSIVQNQYMLQLQLLYGILHFGHGGLLLFNVTRKEFDLLRCDLFLNYIIIIIIIILIIHPRRKN